MSLYLKKDIYEEFKNLLETQEQMLLKAATLLKPSGLIIYMVCSFLKIETRLPTSLGKEYKAVK